MHTLTHEMIRARDEIRRVAESYGLDCFETIFEMVDYDEVNMIAAYGGFPTRYPHWRFGMEYEQLSKSYTDQNQGNNRPGSALLFDVITEGGGNDHYSLPAGKR